LPPSGIASRAFTARFRIVASSWFGQRRCPFGALLRIVNGAACSRDFVIRERAARHVDIADNDCQEVVKVVRNAAGELA
jgi:hypothetical protein